MQPRVPPPILMLIGAGPMWALDHWMPLGQWMSAPWNRLGGLVAAVGIAVAVAAFVRFRKPERRSTLSTRARRRAS